jgi:hypothetical protein
MRPINAIMEFILAGEKRETIRDPMYKKIGKDGRVYIDKNLADQEILIIPVKAIPKDKIDYIKMGRTTGSF